MHIAAISGGDYWYLYDELMAGLNDEQVKTVPRPDLNSIAWLLWHITRIEDMTINFLVLEQPQVLFRRRAEQAAQGGNIFFVYFVPLCYAFSLSKS